jgi:hypothetical protein
LFFGPNPAKYPISTVSECAEIPKPLYHAFELSFHDGSMVMETDTVLEIAELPLPDVPVTVIVEVVGVPVLLLDDEVALPLPPPQATKPASMTSNRMGRQQASLRCDLMRLQGTTSASPATQTHGVGKGAWGNLEPGIKNCAEVVAVATVRVVVPAEPFGVTFGGAKLQVAPEGNPEQAKVTAWLKPFVGVTVRV